jgi:membrane associated rhomboid family serine protease
LGIYDRDYARERGNPGYGSAPGRRGGGAGRMGMLSFNTWLIIINVAVFVIDSFLGGVAGPVTIEENIRADAPRDRVQWTPWLLPSSGAPAAAPALHALGNVVVQQGVDPAAGGAVVGERIGQIMAPLEAVGYCSTFKVVQKLEVWRLVTFQFLHDHRNFSHIFFNMLGLWVFGGMVEESLGRKRYAAFYLVCGICGGLSYLLLNLLGLMAGKQIPGVLTNDLHTPLIGASAGVFGVIMACAYLNPNAIIQLIFPPIPLRMKVLAYGYFAFAALNLLFGGHNSGGDAAHIGGAIAGFFFIRRSHLLRDFFDIFGDSRKPRGAGGAGGAGTPGVVEGLAGSGAWAGRQARADAEMERILTKINAEGLHSLTPEEKRILAEDTERRRGG